MTWTIKVTYRDKNGATFGVASEITDAALDPSDFDLRDKVFQELTDALDRQIRIEHLKEKNT
tara:strand:- start:102 stop:287 length:186 start_codon:yes stop_codon:yes gene_type:complete